LNISRVAEPPPHGSATPLFLHFFFLVFIIFNNFLG